MAGIRGNTLLRIIAGITQVTLGLLMIWLSKQFIDITIRTGTDDDVIQMVTLLVTVVIAGILLRQFFFYLTVKAGTRQSNTIRLRVFSSLFRRLCRHRFGRSCWRRRSRSLGAAASRTSYR